jgi:hypothetical protein
MLASITSTLTDRGLGLPQGVAGPIALVGCSSAGAVDTPTKVFTPSQLVATFGQGPLVELAAMVLDLAGGPVVVCRATTATAGSAGSATRAGSGASPMTAAVSGTPVDAASIKIKVTRAGATLQALTAAVRVSLDGGQTYAEEQPVPASGAVVCGLSGVTVTFTDSSDTLQLYVDNTYTVACTAPVWDTTGLGTALAALKAAAPSLAHDGVVVVGDVDATSFPAVKTSHDALIAASKPRWLLCNARDQDVAGSESEGTWVGVLAGASPGFAGLNANLIAVSAGHCSLDSRALGGIWRRPVSWPIAVRLASIAPQRHPGCALDGALPIRTDGLYHDLSAAALQTLDAQGFLGAQSLEGLSGYIATAKTRAPAGSDFGTLMRARVMVYATRIAMARMVREVNVERLANDDGTIAEIEAAAIEEAVSSYLSQELANPAASRGYASAVSVVIDRSVNIVTTERLAFRLRVTPLGYSTAITLDLGYTLANRS